MRALLEAAVTTAPNTSFPSCEMEPVKGEGVVASGCWEGKPGPLAESSVSPGVTVIPCKSSRKPQSHIARPEATMPGRETRGLIARDASCAQTSDWFPMQSRAVQWRCRKYHISEMDFKLRIRCNICTKWLGVRSENIY
jgi:hypothetical protein